MSSSHRAVESRLLEVAAIAARPRTPRRALRRSLSFTRLACSALAAVGCGNAEPHPNIGAGTGAAEASTGVAEAGTEVIDVPRSEMVEPTSDATSRRADDAGLTERDGTLLDVEPVRAVGASADASPPPNLVQNGDFEAADPSSPDKPAFWTQASWGDNAARFSYEDAAPHGGRSVKVTLMAHTSGDAKWTFPAVSVEPLRSYQYLDRYRSSAETKLVAAFGLSNGLTVYRTLALIPASADWSTSMGSFIAPSDATSVSLFHLLGAVGWLQIDDVSLTSSQELAPDLSSGVPNGSLEQSSALLPGTPLSWKAESYGDLSARFEYAALGHESAHSVGLTIERFVSGDAKWYFDPQPVVPGARYLYSDSYLSTTDTALTVRLTLTSGAYRYLGLGRVPASSIFTPARFAFLAPPDASLVTVFHSLAALGSLHIDDAALALLPPVPIVEGLPNGDLELPAFAGASMPASFRPNVWGSNDTSFSYLDEGHESSRSVRVDVRSYASGSASWYFEEVPVVANTTYRFSDFYRANSDSSVLARVTSLDGSTANLELGKAFASSSWSQFAADLAVPEMAKSITIFHRLESVGSLQTDDYTLRPYTPSSFARALVSITFDDSYESAYLQALPLLQRFGAVATHYVLTGRIDTPGRLTSAQLQALCAAGHQLASHTVNHYDLSGLGGQERSVELSESRRFLERVGCGPPLDFATPFGAYSGEALADIERVYSSHRTTAAGYNTRDNLDVYQLKVQNLRTTTSPAEVASWAAKAAADKSWLIVVYHDVREPPDSDYAVSPASLETQLAAIRSHDITFVTVRQALEELTPQL